MIFLDTNVFIRFFTKDDPKKAAVCLRLFQRIEKGEVEATFSESVLAEVVYWLSKRNRTGYGLTPPEITERLSPLLQLKGMKVVYKGIYIRALELYAQHLHLDVEDALTIAHMEHLKISTLMSYDTDFDSVPLIKRQEPI